MMYSKLADKQLIDKGWSGDKKYCAKTADGTKYLLRITPKEKGGKQWDMFRMQQKCAELGIPMCLPVEIGECEEGIYTIQTWIDGKDAEDVISHLNPSEQYALGFEAGKILKKIHISYFLRKMQQFWICVISTLHFILCRKSVEITVFFAASASAYYRQLPICSLRLQRLKIPRPSKACRFEPGYQHQAAASNVLFAAAFVVSKCLHGG